MNSYRLFTSVCSSMLSTPTAAPRCTQCGLGNIRKTMNDPFRIRCRCHALRMLQINLFIYNHPLQAKHYENFWWGGGRDDSRLPHLLSYLMIGSCRCYSWLYDDPEGCSYYLDLEMRKQEQSFPKLFKHQRTKLDLNLGLSSTHAQPLCTLRCRKADVRAAPPDNLEDVHNHFLLWPTLFKHPMLHDLLEAVRHRVLTHLI